ncbi:MAG: MBL fold metallo-hydrolase [Chloroflexi bacterium]|nr:MAG: MBL fold metallo-hydrolase [Chloroflexota bacterium]
MEVGAGVRRFGSRYINLYLIEEGGRLTLLDAGLPGYWRALLGELEAIGRRLEDIDAVLLTHSHADHRGIAERVRIASGATVYAHALELPALTDMTEGGMPPFFKQGFRPFIYRFVAHSLRNGVARRVPVAALTAFADGEIVDVPGKPRVIHVPGHTSGSCALHLEQRGVVFTGDALSTIDLLTGRAGPALPPDFVNESSADAMESLTRLEGLPAQTVLTGHGEPWTGSVRSAVEIARAAVFARGVTRSAVSGTARPN